MTRESCRFLPLFPLRRGDLAIWASTRENAVKPLSRRSHSDITDAQRQCADRDSSHRDRLPFLLLLPSFRDRVTQSVLTCMNPMHRYHIVQSSVLRIDSTTIANIATICIVIDSNPLAGGRRTEESCRRLRRIVCLYGPLQSDWTTTKTASRSILSRLNVEYIYIYIYIYIYKYIYIYIFIYLYIYIYIYMYSVYPSFIPGKVWRMGLLGTAACWFLLALSRSRICSAAPFVQSALCPLLSRFIRCTDDYRKPHLRSPTLIASPSSSSPSASLSSHVSLPSLRFALRSCISFSRRRRSSSSPVAIP